MKNPFTTNPHSNKETLTEEITKRNSASLIPALLSIALIYGIERTEKAIQATYTKETSAQIINVMNIVIKSTVENK